MMRLSIGWLLVLTSCVALTAQAVEAPKSAKDVSAPVRVGEPGANEAVVIRLPDDSLRIFYVKRPEGTEIRSMGSSDGGLSWGDDRVEFKLPGTAYYGVQVALDDKGEYQCMFHILGQGNNGRNGRHYDIWHNKTSDGRKTWGEPKKIYDGYVGSLRGFTKLKSGRMLLSVSVSVPTRNKPVAGEPDFGWNDAVVFFSDDLGVTWTQGKDRLQVLQDNNRGKTRYGAPEPHVCELLDGRVWMLIRTKNGHFWESHSSDGGTTWLAAQRSKIVSSDSPAATVRLDDGRLVLFHNSCQNWGDLMSYAIGGRHLLHAAISSDDGKTWRGFREVLRDDQGSEKGDRGTAYPAAALTGDGKICLVSGQGEGKKHILLLDPNWIDARSQSDDFSAGDGQWTSYDGKGMQLIDHPEKSGAKALQIQQIDKASQSGATWNFPMMPAGKLTLRVKLNEGAKDASLALTDHYCVIADTLAEQNSVYSTKLSETLQPGKWQTVVIEWSDGKDAKISVDGKSLSPLKPQRKSDWGVNYLRLKSFDEKGLVIESVKAEAASGVAKSN